jgi:hypothetical protein
MLFKPLLDLLPVTEEGKDTRGVVGGRQLSENGFFG